MKMRLKKRKKRGFLKYCLLFLCLHFLIYIYFSNLSFENNNEDFINKLLNNSSFNLVSREGNLEYVSNELVSNPVSLIGTVFAYQDNIVKQLEFSYIQNTIIENPKVYIYSTHPNEKYSSDLTVVDASRLLQDELNSKGIKTTVESKNTVKFMNENNIKDSYEASRNFLNDALLDYDYELLIDLHRDKVPNNVSTKVEINGKSYAKIMFVANKKYSNNYNLALKINEVLASMYPNLTRGVYEKYVDSFNQDLNDNVILVELGSTQNNTEEIKNSIEVLSDAIKEILNEG